MPFSGRNARFSFPFRLRAVTSQISIAPGFEAKCTTQENTRVNVVALQLGESGSSAPERGVKRQTFGTVSDTLIHSQAKNSLEGL